MLVLCAAPTGCAFAFDFDGFHAAAAGVDIEDAATNDGPRDAAVEPSAPVTVTRYGAYRAWSDWTYATSCNAYVHPPSSGYVYDGATGSGVYAVKPKLAPAPVLVYCEMTAKGEGWTLITTSSALDRLQGTETEQTTDCVTQTSYCNVAGEPWDYDALRETWSACPGAEARITSAAFQDDKNACINQGDSLLLSSDGVLVGMKIWNDCTHVCGGGSSFFAQSLKADDRITTLVSDQKYVTSNAGLLALPGGQSCEMVVVSYGCATGYDSLWLR